MGQISKVDKIVDKEPIKFCLNHSNNFLNIF